MYAERRFEVVAPGLDARVELPALEDWRRVLLRAAELVERGWCQQLAQDRLGRICLAEAVAVSAEQLGTKPAQRRIAQRAVQSRIGGSNTLNVLRDMIVWNDVPGRTQGEVVAVLREVARSA